MMLMEQQYTREQSVKANLWILRGDWMFKGSNPTLELSDFYPTAAQIESINDDNIISMQRNEYALKLHNEYEKGKRDGVNQHIENQKAKESVRNQFKEFLDLQKKNSELERKLAWFVKENAKLEAQMFGTPPKYGEDIQSIVKEHFNVSM